MVTVLDLALACDTAERGPDANPLPAHHSVPQPSSTTCVAYADCCEQAGTFTLSLLLSPAATDGTVRRGEQLSSCLIKPKRPRNSQHGHGIRQWQGSSCSGVAQPEPGQSDPGCPVGRAAQQPQLCAQLAPGYSLVTSCNRTVMYLSI